jgi:N-acetylmuramoyl-L-alanine amidase
MIFAILMSRAYRTVNTKVIDQRIYSAPIIIDAGHGGEDSGAIAFDGTFEKDINLTISQILNDMFEVSGFQVIMVRDSDISIHSKSKSTARGKKVSDLQNRLKIAKNNPDSVWISIHQNAAHNKTWHGFQAFFSNNNPMSKDLATSIHNSFVDMLQPNNKRPVKAKTNNFLLRNMSLPAVLIECGFISNPGECKKLVDETYQKKVAFCIYCGYMEYFREVQNG